MDVLCHDPPLNQSRHSCETRPKGKRETTDDHYDCRRARHSRNTKPKKAISSTRYRRHILRGSWISRKSHSSPHFCIHRGARFTNPATTSKVPPTPMTKGVCNSAFHLFRKISFLGEPIATNNISGCARLIPSTTSASSAGCQYPFRYPAIFNAGWRCFSTSSTLSTIS